MTQADNSQLLEDRPRCGPRERWKLSHAEQVVADAGYKSQGATVERLSQREIDGYIYFGPSVATDPEPSEHLPATLSMFIKLATEAGQTV